jgi:phosphoribosylanthranilate isomerase
MSTAGAPDPVGPDESPLFVKICGITSEADAMLAVAFGADALGFIFAPSPRQVGASAVGDIVKRLPHGILTVGVFRDEAPGRVVEIANQIGLGAVQLHGYEKAEDCRWVRQRVPLLIKGFRAGERAIERFDEFGADFLLIDGPSPGSGEVFDWRLAEGVVDPARLIVSGGLRPDNVDQAVAHLHPYGVDVDSGVEEQPGRKDPQALQAFIGNARAAHAALALGHGHGPGAGSDGGLGDGEEGSPYDWMDS